VVSRLVVLVVRLMAPMAALEETVVLFTFIR
jgi:hypothetical protein